MRLKQAVESISGLRFIVNEIPFMTSIARRYFYSEEWITDADVLAGKFDEIGRVGSIVCDEANKPRIENLLHHVSCVLDIEATIEGLKRGDVLGDIELFQLKSFALIIQRICQEIEGGVDEVRIEIADIPSLEAVVDILDPEQTRTSSFYIYDLYSSELAEVRHRLKQAKEEEAAELYQQQLEIEDAVRCGIVRSLRQYADVIMQALMAVVHLDIVIAKIRFASVYSFSRPRIARDNTRYAGLFNPLVKASLEEIGRKYQSIDIEFSQVPNLISGINMGGKTVCLKTIALAQAMFQFAIYVPAEDAEIVIVDCILQSMEDKQSELSGLSSFASEMRSIDNIINVINRGERPLVLIDELARTTNPTEGRAIVGAMLRILGDNGVRSFVTSHYDNIPAECRRLRVRGLRQLPDNVDIKHIDRLIDYSLVEEDSASVPHEALNIARLLNVDEQLIKLAESML